MVATSVQQEVKLTVGLFQTLEEGAAIVHLHQNTNQVILSSASSLNSY
jgi:hypothetical protein